jgi:DNA modification methylase
MVAEDSYIDKIICGDCLEVMKGMPDRSIDMILCDPPYNIGKAEWDKIPDYVEWLGTRFKECERVLKDNGSFYFFHNDFLQMVELQNWLNANSKFVFKQLITWNKIHEDFKNYGYVQQRLSVDMMRNYYNGFTEYCLYYTFQDETGSNEAAQKSVRDYLRDERDKAGYKNKDINIILGYPSNGGGYASHYFGECVTQCSIPTKEHYDKLQQTGYFKKSYEDLRQEYESLRYTFNTARVKEKLRANSNMWLYPPAEQHGHITPKPVPLIENIILHSSNKGDIILDPFGGGGTTAIAAKNLGRDYIIIEIDQYWADYATKRIAQETAQMRMFA